MKLLNKHKLNFDLTSKYVENELKDVNALSIELLNLVDFKNGYFFTLLPEDANFNQLYDFTGGCILPQFPDVEYMHNGIKSTFTPIPDIIEELADLVLKEMESNNTLCCVFDAANFSHSTVEKYNIFINYGLIYEGEIYFFLQKKNVSRELIKTLFKDSTTFWHSLGLLRECSKTPQSFQHHPRHPDV